MVKLFTVGFLRETDELQLVELFSDHGLVKTVTIVRDQITGESKGYAFVEMMDEPGANRAIAALNGFVIAGRTLSVRVAEDKRQSANQERPAGSSASRTDQVQRNHGRSNDGKGKRPRR